MVHARREIQCHLAHVSAVTPFIIPQHFVNVRRVIRTAGVLFISEKCTSFRLRWCLILCERKRIALLGEFAAAGSVYCLDHGGARFFHGEKRAILIFGNGYHIRVVAGPVELTFILCGRKIHVKLVCASHICADCLICFSEHRSIDNGNLTLCFFVAVLRSCRDGYASTFF